ncbi:MAG: PIN domain-containing protein [Phormidesmis sp.]
MAERSIFSSELARLETQIVPTKQNDKDSLQQLERFFAVCKMTELNRAVFDRAIQLRVKSKLKTPDAIHLSAAIVSGCQEFWTDDKQLKSTANNYLKAIGCEDMQKTALDLNSDERKNKSG